MANFMANSMLSVLKKVHLGSLSEKFEREKITPDLVYKLSLQELESLGATVGVTSRSDVMALRIECSRTGTEKKSSNLWSPFFLHS